MENVYLTALLILILVNFYLIATRFKEDGRRKNEIDKLKGKVILLEHTQAQYESCISELNKVKLEYEEFRTTYPAMKASLEYKERLINDLMARMVKMQDALEEHERHADEARLRDRIKAELSGMTRAPAKNMQLLAFIAKGGLFQSDTLAIRRTGWDPASYERLDASKGTMLLMMRHYRTSKEPLHVLVSAHMGPEEILLDDGPVDARWLSDRFYGVKVESLLLAGCDSAKIGSELVGLAKSVIVMLDEVEGEEASVFVHQFYKELVDGGSNIRDAFDRAKRTSPANVAECVFIFHAHG